MGFNTGGAAGGALSGASTGAMVGGPIGAGVGAVAGGIIGGFSGGGKKSSAQRRAERHQKFLMKIEKARLQRADISDKARQDAVQTSLAGGQTKNALRQAMNTRDQTEVSAGALSRILEQNRASGLSTGSTFVTDFYNRNAADTITRQNDVANQDYNRAFQSGYGATKSTPLGQAPAAPTGQGLDVAGIGNLLGQLLPAKSTIQVNVTPGFKQAINTPLSSPKMGTTFGSSLRTKIPTVKTGIGLKGV